MRKSTVFEFMYRIYFVYTDEIMNNTMYLYYNHTHTY